MRLLRVILICCIMLGLTGCAGTKVSKPYVMKMDRVDQELENGNRGYLMGTPPPPEDRGDLKRPFIALDIDLPSGGDKDSGEETRVIETKREVVTEREETPTSVRQKVTVREEEIK
ncbi:MAG: hypothetical protein A2987_06440 [Omnitrophica bacterium RIFCSPLOWO2_01_FULL_45_10]|nr:MAG: hypothetical protein A2987_06440 [Omnitrophica bacterium RIFCSPLOWO2_01_FULL_45_10]